MNKIAVFSLIFVVVGLPLVMTLLTASVQALLTWSIETIDSAGAVGTVTSIAVDSGDDPHICMHASSAANAAQVNRIRESETSG